MQLSHAGGLGFIVQGHVQGGANGQSQEGLG